MADAALPTPAEEGALLEAAAAAGAAAVMAMFRPGEPPLGAVGEKDDGTLITDSDVAANEAIREVLTRARPDYGWLSEEDGDDASRLSASRVFVIDPIDGTRAFAEGSPNFSVSVALVADGAPLAAALHAPAHQERFAAWAGGGAFKNCAPIRVVPGRALDGARVLSRMMHLEPQWWRSEPPQVERRHIGSIALRLARVAEGAWDASFSLRPANEWDLAAAALIATEAGARVTDRRGAALVFNRPDPAVDGVVAAPPALHAEILSRLAP